MKKLALMAVLLSSALLSVESDYEISTMVGVDRFNSQATSGNGEVTDRIAHLGFRFNNFEIKPQIVVEYAKDGILNSGDMYKVALNGVYEKGEKLKAYLLAGAGYQDIENETGNLVSGSFLNVGAGLKYPIFKRVQLQTEAKVAQRFDGTDRKGREYQLLAGINLPLGNVRNSNSNKDEKVVIASSNDSDNDGVKNSNDNCPNTKINLKVDAQGCSLYQLDNDGDGVVNSFDKCPETPEDLYVNSIGCQNDFKKINFDFNTLEIINRASVNKLISYLKSHPSYRVELVGHTDNVGNTSINQTLSEDRSAKVKSILVANGISKSRIITLGLGENSPIVDNSTESNRLANRRVEVTILK